MQLSYQVMDCCSHSEEIWRGNLVWATQVLSSHLHLSSLILSKGMMEFNCFKYPAVAIKLELFLAMESFTHGEKANMGRLA
jgi:hypothetical protein